MTSSTHASPSPTLPRRDKDIAVADDAAETSAGTEATPERAAGNSVPRAGITAAEKASAASTDMQVTTAGHLQADTAGTRPTSGPHLAAPARPATPSLLIAPARILAHPWGLASLGLGATRDIATLVRGASLVRIARDTAAGTPPPPALWVGLFASTLAPGVVDVLSGHAVSRWRAWARREIVDAWVEARRGQPTAWLEAEGEREAQSFKVANDLPWAVGELVSLAVAGGRRLGGVAAHAAFLSLSLGAAAGAGYLGVALAGAAALAVVGARTAAGGDGAAGQAFRDVRRSFWDSLVLGNVAHAERWLSRLDACRGAHDDARARHARRHAWLEGISLALAALPSLATAGRVPGGGAAAPVAGVAHLAVASLAAAEALAALPAWGLAGATTLRTFARLRDELTRPATLDPLAHIRAGLRLSGADDDIVLPAAEAAGPALAGHLTAPGKWRLSGPVGGGKSMLAVWLKAQDPERVFLLPAHHQLYFGLDAASTGQAARRSIATLPERLDPGCRLVVLDEPDANADLQARRAIGDVVDTLAARLTVLVISHRAEKARTA